jgi:protein-S-isoprenylcysteine O-methyltransferase Ste14
VNIRADVPGVLAPPPLIYLGFLLAGWGLDALLDLPGLGLETNVRRSAAFVLVIAGLLMDGIAAGHFRRAGTAVEPWKPTTALATTGLYGFSRNPIYLGFAVTYVGFGVAMDSALALAFLVPCLLIIDRFVIQREERYLSVKFGETYESYRSRVRRWL